MLNRIAIVLVFIALLALPLTAPIADDGVIVMASEFSVAETTSRLEKRLAEKGIKLMARIDHGANAAATGSPLPPMQLLIFGNPKLGTPLIAEQPTMGLDLPMKVLVWEDQNGTVHAAYNDPRYLASRHAISDQDAIVTKMRQALDALTSSATKAKPAEK